MAARTAAAACLLGLAAVLAAGCEPAPIVEFATPHVNMHLEGSQIQDVQVIRGLDGQAPPTVERVDEKYFRVVGTGQVRVVVKMMDTHVVQVQPDHIRVHGVNVPAGEVFVEKKAVGPDGVHVGHVKKP